MRIPHLFLLIVLIAVSSTIFAQSKTERATVEWGPEMSDNENGSFLDVFGYNDDHVYMTVMVKKEVFIRKMDRGHKTVYQKLIPLKVSDKEHELSEVVLCDDRLLVFTTYYDKQNKKNTFYARAFNEGDMKPMGGAKRVASIDAEKRRNAGSFVVRISPDDKAVLIAQQLPYEKEERERFSLKVMDKELEVLWEQEVELPYLDSEFGVESTRVANDRSVLIIGNKYAVKREARELRKDGKSTYEYHILVYHGDGNEPEDHPITVEDKFLQDLTLNIGEEGDILCGGFYGNKGSFSVRGTFFLRIDRTSKKIVHSSFKEFEDDFITMYMTEKEESKATKKADRKGEELELYDFELRDIVRREDGGAVMVGEQYRFYVTTSTFTDANGRTSTTTTYHYHYNDIIVVNVDTEGNIDWATKVPKRQHSTNDGGRYSSYAILVTKEHIYLVFNDSGRNLFLTQGMKVEPFRYGKDMLITLATIDVDGRVHREALLSTDKREAMTRPKSGVQVGDNRLFLYANWKKEHRFGTVVFE